MVEYLSFVVHITALCNTKETFLRDFLEILMQTLRKISKKCFLVMVVLDEEQITVWTLKNVFYWPICLNFLDVDECAQTEDVCGDGISCLNIPGSYYCLTNADEDYYEGKNGVNKTTQFKSFTRLSEVMTGA